MDTTKDNAQRELGAVGHRFHGQYGAPLTALNLPDKIMLMQGIYGDRPGAASPFHSFA